MGLETVKPNLNVKSANKCAIKTFYSIKEYECESLAFKYREIHHITVLECEPLVQLKKISGSQGVKGK